MALNWALLKDDVGCFGIFSDVLHHIFLADFIVSKWLVPSARVFQ